MEVIRPLRSKIALSAAAGEPAPATSAANVTMHSVFIEVTPFSHYNRTVTIPNEFMSKAKPRAEVMSPGWPVVSRNRERAGGFPTLHHGPMLHCEPFLAQPESTSLESFPICQTVEDSA